MARSNENLFTQGTQGAVGKQIVFKQINGKTFATKYPDMSGVEYNITQKEYQDLFAEAVKYAQEVMADPARVAAYEQKIHNDKNLRGTSVYHAALKAFMAKYSRKKYPSYVKDMLRVYNEKFVLDDRANKVVKYLIEKEKISNSIYQQINKVSKPTATRGLQKLVADKIIVAHSSRAGTTYTLADIGSGSNVRNKKQHEDELI